MRGTLTLSDFFWRLDLQNFFGVFVFLHLQRKFLLTLLFSGFGLDYIGITTVSALIKLSLKKSLKSN